MKLVISVPDIQCASCTTAINNALEDRFSNEPSFFVNAQVASKQVVVTGDNLNKDLILETLEAIGFDGEVLPNETEKDEKELASSDEKNVAHQRREERIKLNQEQIKKEQMTHLRASLLLLPMGFGLFALSFFSLTLSWPLFLGISVLSSAACFATSFKMYKNAFTRLYKANNLSMDLLFSISTLSSLAVSMFAFFNPAIGFEFHTALLILGAHRLGKYLESKMKERIDNHSLFSDRLPKTVSRLKPELLKAGVYKHEQVATDAITPGDEIIVGEGQIIPLDGTVINNDALIYTTMQDGDLVAKDAQAGLEVLAGMKVHSGVLRLKVVRPYYESYALSVENSLEALENNKSKLERVSDKIMQYFIPSILAMTLVCGVMTGAIAGALMGVHTALAMLVAACPCALGFIVPFAVKAGGARIAKEGVITNNVQAMEKASTIKTVVFDLNGTLTEGQPVIVDKRINESLNFARAMNLIYTLESKAYQHNKHPIAKALMDYARENKAEPISEASEFESDGNGVSMIIEGERYFLGNAEYAKERGLESLTKKGNQFYLFNERQKLASFNIQDKLKQEAPLVMEQLREKGYRVVLMTWAPHSTANDISSRLKINPEQVYANILGAKAKHDCLKQLTQEFGSIAMVGDGANDLLALKQAHLGISFDNGDETAKSNADFIIKTESLSSVVKILELSKRSVNIIKRCLKASLAYNVSAILLTCCLAISIGSMSPAVMAGLMAVQSIMVLGYAARIKTLPSNVKELKLDERFTSSVDESPNSNYKKSPSPKERKQSPSPTAELEDLTRATSPSYDSLRVVSP